MNICYVNPTNNIRRPIAELSNILAKEGHKITIMYPESKACPTKNWVANEAIKNGLIKLVPIKSWYFAPLRYSFPNLLQLIKETKKIYRSNHKVHIWEYYYPLSIVPILLSMFSKKKRGKTILTTDGFVGYSYLPKEPKWLVPAFKIYTWCFGRWLFKIPRTLTTYGKAMVPFARKTRFSLNKLNVISTGIHLERFQNVDSDKVNDLKKEFKIDEDEKVILFVGMLTERKGINQVIAVSKRLLQEGHQIKTILVGDAHGDNIYQKLVDSKYKEKIIFAGGRKEIPEFMKLGDILFLPSEGEGLPGVVMEAMASGLPIVATKEGCTPDLIEDGKEGFLIEMNNRKEGYYFALKTLLEDIELRKSFAKKGLEKIKNFEWGRVKEKYTKLYTNSK